MIGTALNTVADEFRIRYANLVSPPLRPGESLAGRLWWRAHAQMFRRHPAGYAECRGCSREFSNPEGHARTCLVRLWIVLTFRDRYRAYDANGDRRGSWPIHPGRRRRSR